MATLLKFLAPLFPFFISIHLLHKLIQDDEFFDTFLSHQSEYMISAVILTVSAYYK